MAKDDIIIKIQATHVKTLFPNDGSILGSPGHEFGILSWKVEDVESGYPVYNKYNEVTIKGNYINGVEEDKEYTILAKQVEHPTYGTQYDLLYYFISVDLKSLDNQKAFLRSFLTEGQIASLYDTFENPLEIIDNHDAEKLTQAKGIGEVIANKIIERFDKVKDLSPIYTELDGLGLTTNFINKLILTYQNTTTVINKVLHHPYDLINEMEGVGFVRADKIALAAGFKPGDKERIKNFIIWYLKQRTEEGHSYITAKELNAAIFENLGDFKDIVEFYDENDKSKNNINESIQELEDSDIIRMEDNENKNLRRVYLVEIWKLERDIAYHLKRIRDSENKFIIEDFDEKIKRIEEKQGFEFTDEQIEGIKLGLNNQLCLITGLAGSGKSSVVNGILGVLDGYNFAQCALSGKAAARLQEITGKEGHTIHRLLGYNGMFFMHDEKSPLAYDIIILDEISLVGGDIFLSLLKAIRTGSKLYMLGDPGQLEAIGPLNLASDMMNSDEIPTVTLTKVHRQAQKSGILTTAYDVRKQIQLFEETDFEGKIVRGESKDMIIDITDDKDNDRELVTDYFQKYYESDLINEDIMKMQVISPVKERGESCVYNLNCDIQDIVNPYCGQDYVEIKKRKNFEGINYSFDIRVNDKVMCIKNNYNVLSDSETNISIFNGWTGIVEAINDEYVVVNFPLAEDLALIPTNLAGEYLMLGYASTCHKIQGDSADVVIGVIDYSTPPQMLTSQLVYTLITRAKKKCILVAQNKALRKAISTNFVSSKRTFLPEFLEKSKVDLIDMGLNLWKEDSMIRTIAEEIEEMNKPEVESVYNYNSNDKDSDNANINFDCSDNECEDSEDYSDETENEI